MSAPAKVLLVGHDASRTGAPGGALRWLTWASTRPDLQVAVWLERGGPLRSELAAIGEVREASGIRQRAAGELLAGTSSGAVAAAAGRIGPPRHGLGGPPIVVANTVAAWARAASIRRRSRLVLWVHELDHVADRIVAPAARARLLAATDHVIAEGDRVGAMVRDRWHVPAHRVTVVPSSIDALVDGTASPSGPHQVVAIGSLTARKGPDAFVAVAADLARRHDGLRAAWVGGPLASPTADLIRHDIAATAAPVELVGEVADATSWLPADGIVLHPAREDPDPMAVLEAAAHGIAVVTWDTGGAADLLRSAGLDHLVAAPGDLVGLADRASRLLADPVARRDAGASLQRAAAGLTTDVTAPLVLAAVLGVAE